MTENRKRTSSAESKKAVAKVALDRIKTPPHLSTPAKKHFRQIIARRANIDWNPHDLSCVEILSELMATCIEQQTLLAAEVQNSEDKIPNKERLRMINEMLGKIINFRRTLNIHQAGKYQAKTEAKRFENNAQTQNVVRLAVKNSDLLA